MNAKETHCAPISWAWPDNKAHNILLLFLGLLFLPAFYGHSMG